MSDLKVTCDEIPIEHHKAWIKSAYGAEQVDRKAIQEIAYRVQKANFDHLLGDTQPLIFKAPNSFALFMPYFRNPKEMFTYRLFDEGKVESILETLFNNDDQKKKDAFQALFQCLKRLNKDCQEIQNHRDRCKPG